MKDIPRWGETGPCAWGKALPDSPNPTCMLWWSNMSARQWGKPSHPALPSHACQPRLAGQENKVIGWGTGSRLQTLTISS